MTMEKERKYFLLLCHILGIYLFFIVYGYFQEKLLTQTFDGQKFSYFTFLAVLHNISGSVLSYSVLRKKKNSNPISFLLFIEYFKCALLKFINLLISYKITENISYPVFLIGRSCKVIPILLMNYLLYKRTFNSKKYFSAFILSLGILFFMFNSEKVSKKSSKMMGLILLGANLIIDGAFNSIQDNIFSQYKVTSHHMMFYLNCISSFIGIIMCYRSNEFISARNFIYMHPKIIVDLLCYSSFNVLGQFVIYSMLEKFGAIALTTVTITRKLFTILFSIVIFNHRMKMIQYFGLFLVFSSFVLDFTAKEKKEKKLN